MAEQEQEQQDEAAAEQAAATQDSSPELEAQEQAQPEATRLDQHPRFREVIDQKNRAKEEAQRERERAARLEGELEATRRQAQPQGQKPPVYSLEQLQDAVDAAQISQKDMWRIWEKQNTALIEEKATQKAAEVFGQVQSVSRVTSKRDAYKRLVPNWNVPGTEENRKAEAAFQDLMADGNPRNAATELWALERAFGSLDTLERTRRSEERTTNERPVAEEGAGRSGASQRQESNGKHDWRKHVTEYDRALIAQGRMTEAEVKEQIEWALTQDVDVKLRERMLSRVK